MALKSSCPGKFELDLQLPPTAEAERRAIGIALTNRGTWAVLSTIKTDDFQDPVYRSIWGAICDLKNAGVEIDPLTVTMHLATSLYGTTESEPAMELRRVITSCFTSILGDISGYEGVARSLIEMGNKRRFVEECLKSAEKAVTSNLLETTADIANGHIKTVQTGLSAEAELIDASELTGEIMDTRFSDVYIDKTGWQKLDNAMNGGFHRNQFYLFCGRMKSGKTTTATSICYNQIMAEPPVPQVYICLEQTAVEIWKKMLARWISEVYCVDPKYGHETGEFVSANDFNNKRFMQAHWVGEALEAAREFFKSRGLKFVRQPRMKLSDLKTMIAKIGLSGKYQGVWVDYLQLVRGPLADKGMQVQHLEDVYQTLAELVTNYPIWIAGLCQLNSSGSVRGSEGGDMACSMRWDIHALEVANFVEGQQMAPKIKMWMEMKLSRHTQILDIGGPGGQDEDGNTLPDPAFELDGERGPCYRPIKVEASRL